MIASSMVRVELPQREWPVPVLAAPPPGSYAVYVVDWGHHTSIIVPQPVAWGIGPDNDPAEPFVEYAWGDRDYYTAPHPSLWSGLRALFVTGASTTYVQGWRAPPRARDWVGVSVERRMLSASQLVALVAGLERATDRARRYPRVAGYAGRFYDGLRRYSWWYDCNRWTVARLEAAGLARQALTVVFAGQVARHLIGFHHP